MKNCTILFAMMLACALPVAAQSSDETIAEPVDSIAVASNTAEDEFSGNDEIILKYVPNRFIDNWELSLNGGIGMLINGLGHVDETSKPLVDADGKTHYWDALGGVVDIAATKWFNPYVAARLGWTAGYLPFEHAINNKDKYPLGTWDNYVHVDMLWDWTTQFGGYKPNRVYDAVPYVHLGVVANPICNAGVGGGIGFLNRFHVAEHWLINLDLRGTITTARKYGVESGIALGINVMAGVAYRFDKVGWKKAVENPYKEVLTELREANKDLNDERAACESNNEKLLDEMKKREQERRDLADLVAAITKDTAFYGAPDTMQMTVYYAINSSELSPYERAHMETYLKLIGLNDPNYTHKYKVVGTADAATGSKDINERLCHRRADAIREVLINNGVDPENIITEIEVVQEGDAQLSRASHVIIYPVEKPKYAIPESINLDD